MKRINIKELTNIDKEYFLSVDETGQLIDGTSTLYFAVNPYNDRSGVLKQNGCVLGVDNEDLRERLASQILNLCGVPCANIELMIDDAGKHYCFSYNVLQENEIHIQLPQVVIKQNDDKEKMFLDYMNEIFNSCNNLPNKSIEIKNRLLQIYFMDLIIDHYDRKLSNCKIIYNKLTGEYKAPIAYDYGVAFNSNSHQKGDLYSYFTNEEIMYYMLKNYYKELENTINNIFCILTDENIDLILNNEIYEALDIELIGNGIKNRVNQLQEIIFNLQNKNSLKI